jgi:hypothetical protein
MDVDTECADNPANVRERDRLRKAGILSGSLYDHRMPLVFQASAKVQ